ncbi:putative HNH endonuclease [Acinetobacter phage BUCT629]|nr:NUMOD4 domain-containing protein [Escherichia coli]AYP69081.1 hypothetical protein [Acinetobacter phage vB_AbaM_IME512]QZI85316.1 putative HNH endonuclease [Acinetobacter phage BUCT629]URY98762.1 putative HNH endonuclease [Acinetobacter phage Arbor]
MEQWKEIKGYSGYYISSLGRVKRSKKISVFKDGRKREYPEAFIKTTPRNGYPYVNVGGKRYCIHTLVAMMFLEEKPLWAQVINHKDGDKTNNAVENLEWSTHKDNNRHARINLLNKQHGERCNLTKFSDDVVDAVIILNHSKRFTHYEIGNLFDMSESHVSEIVRGISRSRKTAN